MWGVIKNIFGGGDVIKDGFDLIDSIHTSKEEEIQARTAAKIGLLQAYAPFKLAQRYLAFMFGGTYLVCFFTAFVKVMIFNQPLPTELFDLMGAFNIGWIMLTIVGFYFGAGYIESHNRKNPK